MVTDNIFEEMDVEVGEVMQGGDFQSVNLKTGVDPLFFAETLTTDVELTDAIFDLIDNSIDAARNIIIGDGDYERDAYGLPCDYLGYEIRISLSSEKISIADNCYGISSDVIENLAFYTGKKSSHQFGIGHYGLGLKRALLKAGEEYFLRSGNGEFVYESEFSPEALSGNQESLLFARRYVSQRARGTLFCVKKLKSETINQIKNIEWYEGLIRSLSTRYSIFINKGLKISLKNTVHSQAGYLLIESQLPVFRQDGPLLAFSGPVLAEGAVDVFFDVGVHDKYLFPAEYGSTAKGNKSITKEYGIYFIFNDRVIVTGSFENKHGFSTSFHSEYNGFLCYVRMISENPGDLPWNTAKTEVKVHNPLFASVKKPIEELAAKYRSKAKSIINAWKDTKGLAEEERRSVFYDQFKLAVPDGEGRYVREGGWPSQVELFDSEADADEVNLNESQSKQISTGSASSSNSSVPMFPNAGAGAVRNKHKHTKNWTTLIPKKFPICKNNYILNNLIIEGTQLELANSPHAACLLYRSILEAAIKHFVKKTGNFNNAKDHYYSKGEGKKKNHSEEYKKNQGVDIGIGINWLLDNLDVYPAYDKKILSMCIGKINNRISKMNGVVHGNNIISVNEITSIRDDTIYLLNFLIEVVDGS